MTHPMEAPLRSALERYLEAREAYYALYHPDDCCLDCRAYGTPEAYALDAASEVLDALIDEACERLYSISAGYRPATLADAVRLA